jgi:hypothetical protein
MEASTYQAEGIIAMLTLLQAYLKKTLPAVPTDTNVYNTRVVLKHFDIQSLRDIEQGALQLHCWSLEFSNATTWLHRGMLTYFRRSLYCTTIANLTNLNPFSIEHVCCDEVRRVSMQTKLGLQLLLSNVLGDVAVPLSTKWAF